MKKNYIKNITYLIFIFIFYSSISTYFYQDHLKSHWTSSFDQETILAYNALLFNSGIQQE